MNRFEGEELEHITGLALWDYLAVRFANSQDSIPVRVIYDRASNIHGEISGPDGAEGAILRARKLHGNREEERNAILCDGIHNGLWFSPHELELVT